MNDYITNQMASENIVGMGIALVDSNTTVWARGFGWADREAGIPVNTGTVFRIGSVSKVFTASTILKPMDGMSTNENEYKQINSNSTD